MLPSRNKQDEAPALEAWLARQPIFNTRLDVVGYELLFRQGASGSAAVSDGSAATATLIDNSFLEFGLEKITGGKLAFINLTRDYLCGELELPFERREVVLEVLENIRPDPECLAGLEELRRRGYVIALDDFELTEETRPLLSYANIIKIDVLSQTPEQLEAQVKALSALPVKLLAEKVETREMFLWCRDAGFHWFQGYFFARPMLIHGRRLPPSQMALMEVLARLQSENCDLDEIERLISQDIAISYKLLKIINSSYYGLGYKVKSIQHALVLLGIDTLKKWLLIMNLSAVRDKPTELVDLSLLRARMCERLAPDFDCKADEAFTVGLFSLLDVLMDQDRRELFDGLPLAASIAAALVEGGGNLGELLGAVTAYESGGWERAGTNLSACPRAPAAYLDALSWTWEVKAHLGA